MKTLCARKLQSVSCLCQVSMRRITLTNGESTIVDDDDFNMLSQYTWSYCRYPMTTLYYPLNGSRYRRPYSMHHFIMGCPIRGMVIDHINRDKLDNRRANLRIVPRSVNYLNSDFMEQRKKVFPASLHQLSSPKRPMDVHIRTTWHYEILSV